MKRKKLLKLISFSAIAIAVTVTSVTMKDNVQEKAFIEKMRPQIEITKSLAWPPDTWPEDCRDNYHWGDGQPAQVCTECYRGGRLIRQNCSAVCASCW